MTQRSATAERILEASRTLFNRKGYAGTSVTEIAASIGISQGNLTYHFPAKRDLALALEDDAVLMMKKRQTASKSGPLAEIYIAHLLFGLEVTWRYRFLMRDRIHYAGAPVGHRPDSVLPADYAELLGLLHRIESEGLFIADDSRDIDLLAKSLWIVSRYWIDYLYDLEGREDVSWLEQSAGVRHHLALLTPHLRASAKRDFEAALAKQQI